MRTVTSKNRILLLVLMCLFFISIFCCIRFVTADALHFEQGTGTAEDPYQVNSLSDFARFREEVNGGRNFAGEYVELNGSFSCKRFGDFAPIDGFAGTFDGNGNTLSKLNGTALFVNLEGTVRNLALSTGDYTAIVAGGTGNLLNSTATPKTALATDFSGVVMACYSPNLLLTGDGKAVASVAFTIDEASAERCTAYFPTIFKQKEFTQMLNLNRRYCMWQYDYSPDELCGWSGATFTEKGYAFAGEGTAANPYQIGSFEELAYFSSYVNHGEDYKGVFFEQTADLQSPDEPFLPVGRTDGGNYFFGTYNGAGHTITGLQIDTTYGSVNNGFFGALGGTVMNLGLLEGSVTGANCASFASAGVSANALIINCFSTMRSLGKERTGGIVDNYNGSVVNCWYRQSETPVPLCSYTAGEITNCFSETQLVTLDYLGVITDSEVTKLNRSVLDRLNYGAVFYAMYYASGDKVVSLWEGFEEPYFSGESYRLSGKGTEEKPYLISTPMDLAYFSGTVNGGADYADCYLEQTNDIDLSGIENFVPIGTFDSGTYFKGIYNGKGFAITHLTVSHAVRGNVNNGALFGTLGGTVLNLGILDSSFAGSCVASFAVSGLPEARIVNCYSNATLNGVERSGGIVDNFAGKVLSCWYRGSAPLCSYTATALNYCYAETLYPDTFTGFATGNESSLDGLTQKLNDNLLKACMRTAFSPKLVQYWKEDKCTESPYVFRGVGTTGNPFTIATVEDLLYFNATVNSGTTYEKKVVRQTENLDLSGIDFIPIGLANSPFRFYGTYDGNGHYIENISIQNTELSAVNGFFGSLYGRVWNFGLESGLITGDFVGGIASEGHYLNTVIYNCYSRVTVRGAVRAGGIVDNFGGKVIGCWYDNPDSSIPLCGNKAELIYRCYASGLISAYGSVVGATEECAENLDFAKQGVKESFDEFFNRGILLTSTRYGYVRSQLVMWRMDENGALAFADHCFTLNFQTITGYFGLLLQVYRWNIIAILGCVAAVVAIVLAFRFEKKK